MKNSVTKIALALVAMISMTGCPGKKNSNNNFVPGYGSGYGTAYNYGGSYCQTANCYGTMQSAPRTFATGLGKIQSSHLHAEVAMNFVTGSQVNNFAINSYQGNTQMLGVMNVYSSSQFCPIPPGQYQIMGNGMFGSGMSALSFGGTVSAGPVAINFDSAFLTMINTSSVMGPTFPFEVNGYVTVMSPYGSCGQFVME